MRKRRLWVSLMSLSTYYLTWLIKIWQFAGGSAGAVLLFSSIPIPMSQHVISGCIKHVMQKKWRICWAMIALTSYRSLFNQGFPSTWNCFRSVKSKLAGSVWILGKVLLYHLKDAIIHCIKCTCLPLKVGPTSLIFLSKMIHILPLGSLMYKECVLYQSTI